MALPVRSHVFLILAFTGAVFGMGQLWALAMAIRDGTSPNVIAAAIGAILLVPSSIILIRIMRIFTGRSSGNNTRRS